jgi:N-acetylneuraminic acid mutarotase
MGPEYFEDGEGKTYGVEGDMWSLGCVFYELCTLELKNPLYVELFKKQQKGFARSIEIYIRKNYSQDIADIILQLLQKNPKDRPNSTALMEMISGKRSAKNTKGISGPILKNLIENSSGEESFEKWKGMNSSTFELSQEKELPNHLKEGKSFKTKKTKEQIVDLLNVGFQEEFLDSEPDITVSDYYKSEVNELVVYKITANLLDQEKNVVQSFEKNFNIKEKNSWNAVNYTFKSYGQGIRFVQFIHGSENGTPIKLIGSSVVLSPPTVLNEVIKPQQVKKEKKNWRKVELKNTENLPSERSSFSLVPYEDEFYLFGGCNQKRFFFDFYKFNTSKNQWTRLKNELKLKRSHHSCSVHKDSMFIAGGMKMSDYLNDFYQYEFKSEKWTKLPSLPFALRGHRSLISQDSLYIFGGTSNGKNFFNDLLRFDFLTNKWEIIEVVDNSIIPGRESHTFVEYKDQFFVFGGLTENGISNDLFSFDLLNKEWKKIEYSGPNLKPRSFHSSLILNEKLLIFGGYNNEDGWLNEFYQLDFNLLVFSSIENKNQIPSNRSGHGVVKYNDKMWIYGGFNAPDYFNDLFYCE